MGGCASLLSRQAQPAARRQLEVMVARRPHAVLAKGKPQNLHPHSTSSWTMSAGSRAGCKSVCGFPVPGPVGAQMHLCF